MLQCSAQRGQERGSDGHAREPVGLLCRESALPGGVYLGCTGGSARACGGLMSVGAQVRNYLHVVLCFSPVGERFRIRARQFPALVNCTAFDWFHTWPSEVRPCPSCCLLHHAAGLACSLAERRPW